MNVFLENDLTMPTVNSEVLHSEAKIHEKLTSQFNNGGEGIIYTTNGGELFKIYHREMLNDQRKAKIKAMVAKKLTLNSNICWPTNLVFDSRLENEIIGFSMPKAQTDSGGVLTLSRVLANMLSSTDNHWHFKREHLARICIKIARAFNELHENGILMGDVNPENILIDKNCSVFLIDTDSYQFEDFLCPVGVVGFSAAKFHEKGCRFSEIPRTLEDEFFALTCLFFHILFLSKSPFPTNDISDCIKNKKFKFNINEKADMIWNNLSNEIKTAFINAFTKGEVIPPKKWTVLFTEFYEAVKNGRYSNEIIPKDCYSSEHTKPLGFVCAECGTTFTAYTKQKLCVKCDSQRKLKLATCVEVTCSKCGEDFVSNFYEVKKDTDFSKILCDDCRKEAQHSAQEQEKFVSDKTKERVERLFNGALKHSQKGKKIIRRI